jgi:hypothetical protein
LCQTKVALPGEGVETPLNDLDLRKTSGEVRRAIRTETIDNYHTPGPRELPQSALDVWRFLEGQNQRRDIPEH